MNHSKLALLILLTVFLVSCTTLTPEDRIVNTKRSITLGNYNRALIHLRPLLNTGNTEADYLLGVIAFKNKKYDHAKNILLPLAENGYEPAYMQLAKTYQRLDKFEEAAAWIKKAAEIGNSDAQFQLAQIYWHGHGMIKDRAATFTIIDIAYNSPQTREEAAGWRELYEFIIEMEEEPQEMPDGGCIVYINSPVFYVGVREKTSKAWCDKRLDSTVGTSAIEDIKRYINKTFPTAYNYQAKAEYLQKSTGIRINGIINKSRGFSRSKFGYESGLRGRSSSFRELPKDSLQQRSKSSPTANELVDLMIDPEFLLNANFSRDMVSVDGVKLGDSEDTIPQERINKQKTESEWLHLNNGARFRLEHGVIVEIGVPKSRTKALKIASETDILQNFGEPNRIERVTAGSIVLVKQYHYVERGLIVHWADRLGGLAHITVFAKGVCAGFNCR